MNIDKFSNSKYSPYEVTSKYFPGNRGMDESLSDFEEKKKSSSGPKTSEKCTKSNAKIKKKGPKRTRGQKDIRTILKSNKNKLVAYANDFDKICKQSGIDVDSEQLQIAIALSKSLQQSENKNDNRNPQSSRSLTFRDRTGKIRTTLQEYGFKVPEIKITTKSNKVRKQRKDYKLLLTAEAEKQQIISDKYSQVLIQNLDSSKVHDHTIFFDNSARQLFHIATNIPYESIKNNNLFYVGDLMVGISQSSVGCLLKDWSKIPGRPATPTIELPDINFYKVDCLQNELDIVLGGSLITAQDIVNNKYKRIKQKLEDNVSMKIDEDLKESNIMDTNVIDVEKRQDEIVIEESFTSANNKGYSEIELIDVELPQNLTVSHLIRSCSPDIFDDELSSIMDNSKSNTEIVSQELSYKNITKECNDFMDLTECVNKNSQRSTSLKPTCQFSQSSNTRRSNDFMEMTNCVAGSSQTILLNNVNIDLTLSSDQCSNKIIILDEFMNVGENRSKKDIVNMDLTQSSSSDDSLPFIPISGKRKSLDDTIILNENDYNVLKITAPSSPTKTISVDKVNDKNKASFENLPSTSFFEDFIHQHSDDNIKEDTDENKKIDESPEKYNVSHRMSNHRKNDIDLTQTSGPSEEITIDQENSGKKFKNSLGKCGDVSIDYDEIFDNIVENHSSNSKLNSMCNHSVVNNITVDYELSPGKLSKHSNSVAESSQNSEVFEISDNELDYSLYQSKRENLIDNFDVGGISIMDNLSSARSNKSVSVANESFLPMVDIPGTKRDTEHKKLNSPPQVTTPLKEFTNVSVETPPNNEYIIKTDQITPMIDYASLTTPERNKQLDKYGLKPFKRKKAVQLLTHLYNQTHPIVEACFNEDLPSPTKRLKINDNKHSPKITETQLTGMTKSTEMVERDVEKDKENDLHLVTNAHPDIKEIECCEMDWVFQKREKAKLHSCRVPLHIAFHNYVSSRRGLREAILRYEPVEIDIIHKGLVENGHRYDPKDILRFMDRKCITVKTTDNNPRNNKKHY